MKKFFIYLAFVVVSLIISACAFYPVVSQVEFEARQTAQAEVALLPTVTPEPPMVTVIAPEVVPGDEVGDPVQEPTPVPPCEQVKGNISSSGEKIFHVPGSRNYNQVKIDESKGEMWFCSAEDAEAAGWRRAKN